MARLSCGIQCSRLTLLVLNVVFLIFGFVLLGFGIFFQVSKRIDVALSDHIHTKIIGSSGVMIVGYIMTVVAAFTILLSAFGCCGAFWKNRVLLYIYSLILGLLIIAQFAGFVVALSCRTRLRDSYENGFREVFNDAYQNNRTDLQQAIEDVERQFRCCGVKNVTDYRDHHYQIPSSCHRNDDIHLTIYYQGCSDAVINWFENQLPLISGILGSILFIEVFGVIISISLTTAIAHSSYNSI